MTPPDATPHCPACGASMASDQRYCLTCGERRGAPRVAFPAESPGPAPLADAPPPLPPPPPPLGPAVTRSPAAVWVAAVGVLVLAMGVGVLIGRSADGQAAPARAVAPITVTVPTGGAAATPVPTATPAAVKTTKDKAAKKDAGKQDAPASTAGKQELQQLEDLSPEDYQKKSKALPKTVGTEGAAPPKDDKPAGGGSDFEEIG